MRKYNGKIDLVCIQNSLHACVKERKKYRQEGRGRGLFLDFLVCVPPVFLIRQRLAPRRFYFIFASEFTR